MILRSHIWHHPSATRAQTRCITGLVRPRIDSHQHHPICAPRDPNALCSLPTKAACGVAASIRTRCVPSHQHTHIAIAAAHPPPSTTKPRTHDDSAMQSITRNGCKRYSDRFSIPSFSLTCISFAKKSYMRCGSYRFSSASSHPSSHPCPPDIPTPY